MGLPVIETSRLVLKPVTVEDLKRLHDLWTAPEVRLYLWDNVLISGETAAEVIAESLRAVALQGIGYWVVESESVTAGFCGFRFIAGSRGAELMYALRGAFWGKGLATEACRAVLDYLWEATDFDYVSACTDPPNQRSIAVMARLGMTPAPGNPGLVTYVLRRPDSRRRGCIDPPIPNDAA